MNLPDLIEGHHDQVHNVWALFALSLKRFLRQCDSASKHNIYSAAYIARMWVMIL